MKNTNHDIEITSQDLDSILLWKVFWKLIQLETPFIFFAKLIILSACFSIFLLVIFLVDGLPGN
jgi:hypothetical protein